MTTHYLPVAVHVARREAMKTVILANGFRDGFESILTRVLDPIHERFQDRARLTAQGYAEVVASARECLMGFGPIRFEEAVTPATPARPKSEETRFKAIVRWGWDREGHAGQSPFDLFGFSLAISRKRATMTYTMANATYTRHVLERSIERDLATWTGRFIEVEDAIVDGCGLMVAWRHACARGLVTIDEFALPVGDGLLLGQFKPSNIDRIHVRVDIGSNGWIRSEQPRNPAHVPPVFQDVVRQIKFACSTAVQDALLSLPQIDLRDGLREISARHAETLAALGNACFWALDGAGFHALAPGLDAVVADLAALLRRRAVQGALRRDGGWIELATTVVCGQEDPARAGHSVLRMPEPNRTPVLPWIAHVPDPVAENPLAVFPAKGLPRPWTRP